MRLNRSICSVCYYQKASDVFFDTPVIYFMAVASVSEAIPCLLRDCFTLFAMTKNAPAVQ